MGIHDTPSGRRPESTLNDPLRRIYAAYLLDWSHEPEGNVLTWEEWLYEYEKNQGMRAVKESREPSS